MTTVKNYGKMSRMALMMASGAFMFQFGLGTCVQLSQYVNPCGTVFPFCAPEDLDLLQANIPDYEFDPSCTIPGACGDNPFGGTNSGGGTTGPGPRPEGPPPP